MFIDIIIYILKIYIILYTLYILYIYIYICINGIRITCRISSYRPIYSFHYIKHNVHEHVKMMCSRRCVMRFSSWQNFCRSWASRRLGKYWENLENLDLENLETFGNIWYDLGYGSCIGVVGSHMLQIHANSIQRNKQCEIATNHQSNPPRMLVWSCVWECA